MRTMSMLFCLHGAPVAPPFGGCAFNHPVVISNLIWAVVVILLGAVACCFLKKRLQFMKDMANADHQHEKDMKEKSFEIEERWYKIKKEENNNEQIKKLKEEIEELKSGEKIKEIDKELKQKKDEIEMLNKQLELYKKAMDDLQVELQTKKSK